jgi:hypothetical protein
LKLSVHANNGWVCEEHPDQPWVHEGCGAARVLCKTHSATKMQILFLNLFAMVAQRNDLAVLSNGFDRSPATLIR